MKLSEQIAGAQRRIKRAMSLKDEQLDYIINLELKCIAISMWEEIHNLLSNSKDDRLMPMRLVAEIEKKDLAIKQVANHLRKIIDS